MTTPKFESQARAQAREKADRIRGVAKQHADELERLRAEMAAADAELKAAEQHDADVLLYANTQGLPPEIAEQELVHRSGKAPKDALQMTPAQYAEHKRTGGFA